jgi:hypothetical protein
LTSVESNPLQLPSLQDSFTINSLIDWLWYDEFDNCSYKVQKDLVIYAANACDLWYINQSAPRLLHSLPSQSNIGKGQDFVIQTSCIPATDDRPTIGGLLIWQDKENYLRLDRGVFGKNQIAIMGCIDNEDIVIGRGLLQDVNADEKVYLRLEYVNAQARALCSADGEQWWTAGSVVFPVQGTVQVGMHAIGEIDRSIYHSAYPEGTAIKFTSFSMWVGEDVRQTHVEHN